MNDASGYFAPFAAGERGSAHGRPAVSLDHASLKDDFTEEHAAVPGVLARVFPLVALLLVVLGDFASFNIALSRSFASMSTVMVMILTAAMTAAAVLLMVEAGQAEAKRRSRNRGKLGRAPVRWRVLAWLVLGVTALLLRMAAPPEDSVAGGFGTGSGFGTPEPAGFGESAGSGLLYLGPLELHTANLTSALALLAIFVAGGVGAFWFGRETYNPRLAAVHRAGSQVRVERRKVRRARRKMAAASLALDEIEGSTEQFYRARAALTQLSELEHDLAQYDRALTETTAARERAAQAEEELAAVRGRITALPDVRQLTERELSHIGEEAKQRARVRIAVFKGEPAATSGLVNGVRA